jgi:uncharacterized protein YdeI (YjbR/CyaY-like superfamily)
MPATTKAPASSRPGADLPRVEVRSRAELRAWLEARHRDATSVWLVTWKKPSPWHVPWPDVVDEALCFGFIDSLPRKLDAERSMLRLSPRSDKSGWSAVNKEKVARLVAEGRMRPAGLAAVARAKANGTWGALDGASALAVPDDLRAALDELPPAADNFAAFPPSVRRAILEWVSSAKRPETRAKRVRETASLARRNVRANQWR